jgi:hypothetical protein
VLLAEQRANKMKQGLTLVMMVGLLGMGAHSGVPNAQWSCHDIANGAGRSASGAEACGKTLADE